MAWELTGNSGTDPASDFLGTVDGQPLVIRTNGAEAMRVNVAGSGSSALEIAAQDGVAVTGFQPFITLRDTNAGNARSVVQGVDGHVVLIPDSFIGSGGAAMVVKSGSGNVGIGTPDPASRLEVISSADGAAIIGRGQGNSGVTGTSIRASGVTGLHGDPRLQETTVGNDGARAGVFGASDVGAGLVGYARDPATPAVLAFGGIRAVAMDHRLAGEFSGDLQVDGDIFLPGADCAEQFDLDPDDPPEAGDVVIISSTGRLQRSARCYDKAVAGVISGAGTYRPGVILNSRPRSDQPAGPTVAPGAATAPAKRPIALVGKVFCRVDAEYGGVDVGDLLTTSDTPGHAMRANDPTRAFGSVLGKALGRLSEGRGLVPILVCLQ